MPVKQLRFNWAYGFADSLIREIETREDSEALLDYLEPDDTSFENKVLRPHKNTLLHDLIRNFNRQGFDYSTGHWASEEVETYASILSSARMPRPNWLTREAVEDHIRELDQLLLGAIDAITEATFFLLFSDREFLSSFQSLVSEKITAVAADSPDLFNRVGLVKRCNRYPAWLRKAVFFRDKGRCQECFCDLTGVVALDPTTHLDHMRPLGQLGSNDPTNFQLLCAVCNTRKGSRNSEPIYRSFTYW